MCGGEYFLRGVSLGQLVLYGLGITLQMVKKSGGIAGAPAVCTGADMVHRIFRWIKGYIKVRVRGNNVERFVNLCRNRGMVLWNIHWDREQNCFYFRIGLSDFYSLRPVARKCRVRVVVLERFGLPFVLAAMRKRGSFWLGVCACACLVVFLSSRIWGISIEGESYHTRDSILSFFDDIGVYGGMAAKDLHCSSIEKQLRKKYKDIGWASVEQRGSKIFLRIKEVILVEKEKKKEKGHLIAEKDGKVVSIVTRSGTAKVKAGDKVKKGDVLISGTVKIVGDGEELVAKKYVHAEGTVVLQWTQDYKDTLQREYQKKVYTGRERQVHELRAGDYSLFYYNPLKSFETYEKYDIIQDSGQLYPGLSARFPVGHSVKTFREIVFHKAVYGKEEAQGILGDRLAYYLERRGQKGITVKSKRVRFTAGEKAFQMEGQLVFEKEQAKYRKINKKNETYKNGV